MSTTREYTVTGKDGADYVFRVKPTSRKVMNEFLEWEKTWRENLIAAYKESVGDIDPDALTTEDQDKIAAFDEEYRKNYDTWAQKFELFKILTIGPHEKLDPDEFNTKLAEDALGFWNPNI